MLLLLIDANSLIHRCYHALPPLSNKKGEPTGALYGVANILLRIMNQLQPDYCAALFDRPEPTFRKQKYADYKIHRPKADNELVSQLIKAHDLFAAFSIKTYELAGYEADDLIGTFAVKFGKQKNIRARILTGDLDTLQLVKDGNIEVETFKKGIGETVVYDEAGVRERYGLEPNQLIDYKALVGDASDNIPGVPNVGPKTAAGILQKFKTLDAFFANGQKEKAYEKIHAHRDIALLSRDLATVNCSVPVEANLEELACTFDPRKALAFFEENNFGSMIKRISSTASNILGSHPVISASSVIPAQAGIQNPPDLRIALQLLEYEADKPVSKPEILKQLEKKGLMHVWQDIEVPLIPVIEAMQQAGIAVDKNQLRKTEKKLDAEIQKQEKKLRAELGDINFNSPKQLLELLNKKFNLKLKSTAADAMEKAAAKEGGAFAKAVAELRAYRELFKMQTTYLRPLGGYVQPDGRIHPTFAQIGAATGRIACLNPNLQNIPQESEWSPEIRSAFVAPEGYSLVSCDYSQIELRVLAHLSQDQNMLDAFTEGKDIHARTAAFVFGVPEHEVTKHQRRMAKTLNFGMVYGMGSRAFAQSAGIPADEAKQYIKKYFEEFSAVKVWQEKILQEARKKGFVQNENGRIRTILNLYAANQFLVSEAERAAINMPSQSLAADILKLAMARVHDFLKKEHKGKARMLLTVHDELIFEVPDTLLEKGVESEVVQDVQKLMESAYKLSVPLATSASVGKSWKELK